MKQKNTKKLVLISVLCALAYVVMLVGRIPVVLFLKYDPKDVIITLGGFFFGPLTSLLISTVVSVVEMFTASDTGVIGCVMNILSSAGFACTAAFLYHRKRTFGGALLGLSAGVLAATALMLLWNYLVTPWYMGYPREAVVELLMPVFLPFNLLKGGLNAALVLLLYKPLVGALRKAHLLPENPQSASDGRRVSFGPILLGALLLITCVMLLLVFMGKL